MLMAFDKPRLDRMERIEESKQEAQKVDDEAVDARVAELMEKLKFANETIASLVDSRDAPPKLSLEDCSEDKSAKSSGSSPKFQIHSFAKECADMT